MLGDKAMVHATEAAPLSRYNSRVQNSTHQSEKPIGDIGEEFVEYLCCRPLGKDFLFRGQMYRTKDSDVELCDLLLLLDDTAVLMEVKTALRDKKQGWTEKQWADWANRRIEKAISQIERGCNALLTGQVKHVENDRQGRIVVDPSCIKHLYGIAVVDHPTLDKWGKMPSLSIENRNVSVLTTTHEELGHLLTELSTAGDLVDYLQAREAFFVKHSMFGISELDLLAVYKGDPDQFNQDVTQSDLLMISEGCWAEFEKLEERSERDKLDKYSYAVDAIINILYESRNTKLSHIKERQKRIGQAVKVDNEYITIATELAKIRRINRRVIGNKLLEKSQKCVEQKRDRWFMSAPGTGEGPAFVFLVSTDEREERIKSLEIATWGGKLRMKVRRIIGIATEPITGGHGFSVDAIMIDQAPDVDCASIPPDLQKDLKEQFGSSKRVDDTEFGGPAK